MATIKIGSSKDKKGISVDPSIVFFNGNNVKRIMKGATEIWNYIKALVPKMTSNTTPSGEVIANDYLDNYYPFKVFNGTNINTYDSWVYYGNGSNIAWIGYKFTSPVCISKVFIANRNEVTPRGINSFKIQGSNDKSTWTDVSEVLNNTGGNVQSATSSYEFDNDKNFIYYRLFVVSVHDTRFCGLGMLQFYGYKC